MWQSASGLFVYRDCHAFWFTSLFGVCVKAPFRTAATLAFWLSGSSVLGFISFMFFIQQTDFFPLDLANYNAIKPKVPRKLIQCETFTKLRFLYRVYYDYYLLTLHFSIPFILYLACQAASAHSSIKTCRIHCPMYKPVFIYVFIPSVRFMTAGEPIQTINPPPDDFLHEPFNAFISKES